MDSVGEGEGGKIWENGIETCKISCKKKKLKKIKITAKKKKEEEEESSPASSSIEELRSSETDCSLMERGN